MDWMDRERNIWVVGGDLRQRALARLLREDGHTFEINHLTTNQQEVFGTTSLFHRQVASALGIPAKYHRGGRGPTA